jgi:hypothetical protein
VSSAEGPWRSTTSTTSADNQTQACTQCLSLSPPPGTLPRSSIPKICPAADSTTTATTNATVGRYNCKCKFWGKQQTAQGEGRCRCGCRSCRPTMLMWRSRLRWKEMVMRMEIWRRGWDEGEFGVLFPCYRWSFHGNFLLHGHCPCTLVPL